MKILLTLLAGLLLAAPAWAASLTCTVPTANLARAVQLCEELRQEMRVRPSAWSNDVCASQFLRIGLLTGERASTTRTAKATVATLVNDAIVTMESTWPRPAQATCGDSIVDPGVPFLEQCDDGNQINGDGCSDGCQTEP